MTRTRCGLLLIALFLGGCLDGTEPLRPTTIEVTQPPTSADAGATVTPPPTFRVLDQNGDPMTGIAVEIEVTAGGGTITGAPAESGEVSVAVGTWTLGPTVGSNQLTIRVDGVEPATLTIQTMAGPPAEFAALPPDSVLTAEVGTELSPAPRITVTDRFGNPVPGAEVALQVTGGQVPDTLVADSTGVVALTGWVLGTASGEYSLTLSAGSASIVLVAIATPGPPAALQLVSGGRQAVPAGVTVPDPIRFSVVDRFGNGIAGQQVSFALAAGGGTLRGTSTTTGSDGIATAPDWSLGLSAVPQVLRATAASFSADVQATVQTSFDIDLRFSGSGINATREAVFVAAANRIRGVVTGDLSAVSGTGIDPSACGVDGVAAPTGTIDDLIIYASIEPIDGVGQVLASAGPCYVRNGPGLPVVGVMTFDDADIAVLQQQGTLVDVVIHEMLHVLGIGIGLYWDPFLVGDGTSNPLYTGAEARQGCIQAGGSVTCAGSVPVENTGGAGTRDSHWRESVFDSELMTGYAESGEMPFSRITIGSLQDIGYQVNFVATDDYSVPFGSLRSAPALENAAFDRILQPSFEIGGGRIIPLENSQEND